MKDMAVAYRDSYERGHKRPLYYILNRLEYPDLGETASTLPLNPESASLTPFEIGIAYAHFVGSSSHFTSPGRMLQKSPLLPREAQEEFKQRFQHASRSFLYRIVGDLERDHTSRSQLSDDLKQKSPIIHRAEEFHPISIERKVLEMFNQGLYFGIGEKLSEGATGYLLFTRREGMRNCHIAKEYDFLAKAFYK